MSDEDGADGRPYRAPVFRLDEDGHPIPHVTVGEFLRQVVRDVRALPIIGIIAWGAILGTPLFEVFEFVAIILFGGLALDIRRSIGERKVEAWRAHLSAGSVQQQEAPARAEPHDDVSDAQ